MWCRVSEKGAARDDAQGGGGRGPGRGHAGRRHGDARRKRWTRRGAGRVADAVARGSVAGRRAPLTQHVVAKRRVRNTINAELEQDIKFMTTHFMNWLHIHHVFTSVPR